MSELDAEDAKLVVLARAARLRAFARGEVAEGAGVRDIDGRTYTAATVAHPDPALSTSALRGALSAAFSSGARAFEAAVLVTTAGAAAEADVTLLLGLAGDVPLHVVSP